MIRPFGCTSYQSSSVGINHVRVRHIIIMVACAMIYSINGTNALQVYINGTAKPLLYHMRAEFGPWVDDPHGTVTGPLIAAAPFDCCSDTEQIANFTGGIAFIGRGNCSFVQKIWLAQRLGAQGAIVANNVDTIPHLTRMGSGDPPTNASRITIPSIFVSFVSGITLQSYMNTMVDNATVPAVVIVAIDEEGEMDNSDIDFSSTLRLAGWILLILPMLWCFLACFYVGRRRCIQRSNRIARLDRSRNIPIVPYRPLHDRDDSKRTTTPSVINVASPSAADPMATPRGDDDTTPVAPNGPINPSSSNGDLHLVVSDDNIAGSVSPPVGASPASDSSNNTPRSVASPNAASALMSPASKKNAKDKTPRIHNEACAICLEDFALEQKIKLLPCNHGFHTECIDPWINHRSDLCPICKTSILAVPQRPRRLCC